MSTFVVVHGAWGSPSEMEPIVDPLTRAGHRSILVDLPCTAPDATLDDYAGAVAAALPSDLSDVVLVGHSFGGFTISTIGARHPELTLVYVAALMPDEGSSLVSMILGEDPFVASDEATGIAAFGGLATSAGPGLCALDIEQMVAVVSDDERDSTRQYLQSTQRNQGIAAMRQPWTGPQPTNRSTYVVTTKDTLVAPEQQRAMADSIGARVVEIDTDHSAFGEQPEQLAELLIAAAIA